MFEDVLRHLNYDCHIGGLKSINLGFLPPNVTSVLQPIEQGVIKSLKLRYRDRQISTILARIEKEESTKLNVLDAVLLLEEVMKNVASSVIANCFHNIVIFDELITIDAMYNDDKILEVLDEGNSTEEIEDPTDQLPPVLEACQTVETLKNFIYSEDVTTRNEFWKPIQNSDLS
ncbi:uncharacterized protein [Musca autumnalis]|uniref:uncharacterized protein n=1 Tax=Musca autumnalis TaxID=221902 RepID=UPI003CE6E038